MKSRFAIIGLSVLAVGVAGVYLWQRMKPSDTVTAPPRPAAVPTDRHFADLDAWRQSGDGQLPPSGPVVFIGIDGGSWRFIDPLIEAGELPNLERIKQEGSFATLLSTACYVSPPAWVSMFTGCRPAKTGVYTFGRPEPGSYLFVPVTAEDVHVPSVWDVASYAGRRVAVINVPVTYPVRPVNGIMISGIMTPNDAAPSLDFDVPRRQLVHLVREDPAVHTYSPVAKAAFGDALNTLLLAAYDTVDDGRVDYDLVQVTVLAGTSEDGGGAELGSYSMPIGRYSPWMRIRALRDGNVADAWCKLIITSLADQVWKFEVSPTVFEIGAPYIYPPEFQSVLRQRFGYYMPSKLLQEDMVPTITQEAAAHAVFIDNLEKWDFFAYVFTQSDNIHHVSGFGSTAVSVYKTIDSAVGEIMRALPEDGTLVIASDHGFEEYRYSIDLNQYLASLGLLHWRSPGVVDYERTLVYHNLWHLYFNRKLMTPEGLQQRGIDVSAGADVDSALVSYLITVGKNLSAPFGPFPLDFEPLERGVGETPDMLVRGTYPTYTVDFWNLKVPRPSIVRESTGGDKWDHTRQGVFMAWGRGVVAGHDAGTENIEDVAPTLLYLMGLPVAAYIDGRVLADVLDPAFVAARPRPVVPDYAVVSTRPLEENAEREALEKKLRSLGYIR